MIPSTSTELVRSPGQDLSTPARSAKASTGFRGHKMRHAYVLMAPGLVLIAMFSIYPLVMSWYYSFFNWDGIRANKTFIGLANFRELARDGAFWHACGRSAWFAAVATPVELGASLLLAIILNEQALKLAPIYRTIFFLPVVTTTAIVSIVLGFVFSPFQGPVNDALVSTHLIHSPIDFLGNPHHVMWTAILLFVWKWMGQPMIYWLAGLQTIPADLYEACRIDGGRWWHEARYITAPLLAPFAVVITLVVAVGNMQVFAFLQALTNGGPYFASETMELFIYRTAFGAETTASASVTRLGYASAAGVFFGLLVVIIAIGQGLAVRRFRGAARP